MRALAGVFLAALIAAVGSGCGTGGPTEGGNTSNGKKLFLTVGKCGSCHELKDAGSRGQIGPNLDDAFRQVKAESYEDSGIENVVLDQIRFPREGSVMPADLVEGSDAEDVAAYVASVAGIPGAKPPELPPDQLFTERCGSCHALQAAGTSGTTGPDLDEALVGKNARYIEQQIVDPNSQITQGFGPDVMPQDFESSLTPQDLQGLVDYLLENVGS